MDIERNNKRGFYKNEKIEAIYVDKLSKLSTNNYIYWDKSETNRKNRNCSQSVAYRAIALSISIFFFF